MKKYEAILIIDGRNLEDQGKVITDGFGELVVSLGGTMEETVCMGRKQFAREMKKKKAGIYYSLVFSLDEDKVISLHDKYRLNENVLRLQVYNYKKIDNPVVEEKEV